ncbi:MAG: ABC transporter ATP-binding protein [Thermoleophilia bacterium]
MTPPPPAENVVQMLGVTKRFGATTACDRVDFALRRGEIHALLGENGAGKTTLMSLLFGLLRPDDGRILVNGHPVEYGSPREALADGVGMVHQHFMLVPDFTVAENIALGTRPWWRGAIRRGRLADEVREVGRRSGLEIDPDARVRDLPVDTQQRIEILKLLYRGARILVLDEPTASLGPAGVAALFDALRRLAADGHSAVLITHKLSEVMEIADRVTVLRGGRSQGVFARGDYDEARLARAMTGSLIAELPERERPGDARPVLRVSGLVVRDGRGVAAVDGVSLEVGEGEILGLAGVEGNGQRELSDVLAGVASAEAGTVELDGVDVTGRSPLELHSHRVSVIPEDRLHWGLIADMTLADNLALARVAGGGYARRGLLDRRAIAADAARLLEAFGVRPPNPEALASQLSGGNQQKVVIAREIAREPRLLIAAQPTRGLDVGAIDYVHRELLALRGRGAAILLVTNELDELIALSDRIAVIYRGRLIYEAGAESARIEDIGLALAGVPGGTGGSMAEAVA